MMARLVMMLCLLACWSVCDQASAQPAGKALAESLFQDGRRLVEAGEHAAACDRFEASQRIEARTGTLLNIAICHDKLGKTASAWAEFTEVAVEAKREGQHKRVQYAQQRVAALEKLLTRMTLRVTQHHDGLVVSVDGRPLDAASYGIPLPFDPGAHVIAAQAPNKRPWEITVELAVGPSTQELMIPTLEDAPAPPPQPAQVAPPPPEVRYIPQPVYVEARTSQISPLLYIGASIAGAGLIVGTITGAASLAEASDFRDACGADVCPTELKDEHARAVTLANVSNGSFITAGVGAALGIVGVLLSDFGERRDNDEIGATRIHLRAGPGSIAATIIF